MVDRWSKPMRRLPLISIRTAFLSAGMVLASVVVASCGTTCVAGIFANGTGIVLVKNSTPPPACPFSTGMGMMSVTAMKSQICENCTASSRAEHVFVALKGIQLHSVFPESPNNPEWVELAPELAREPRRIDMVGDSPSEVLVQNVRIQAGTYRELRLQFSPGTPTGLDSPSVENSCGDTRQNCMLMADGHIEELHFEANGNAPDLLIPLQNNGNGAVAIVPDANIDLRFTLQPQTVSSVSTAEGWHIHYVLVGSAWVSR